MSSLITEDCSRRFLFEEIDARGCYVNLRQSLAEIQATHHYPEHLAIVLNQFALAVVLLRDSIKLHGSITLQLRSPGPISLIMADCLDDNRVRAIAEYDAAGLAANDPIDLAELDSTATLAITVLPLKGERYQSIVPIEAATLQGCLEGYFSRSEQLPTGFALHATREQAVGVALHALPLQMQPNRESAAESFNHLMVLLSSLTADEALALSVEEVLTRLFHQESCRLFEPHPVRFGCECSAAKSLQAICSLGQNEVEALILEQQAKGEPGVVVDCHFCFQRYHFDYAELAQLFAAVETPED